jgi:hypothetical protein
MATIYDSPRVRGTKKKWYMVVTPNWMRDKISGSINTLRLIGLNA